MLFLNSKPFAVYIARFWSITLSSLANNSLNFITFGCLQYYDLIYLFLSSVYNEHSNIKWNSSSSLLHIVHFFQILGCLLVYATSQTLLAAYKRTYSTLTWLSYILLLLIYLDMFEIWNLQIVLCFCPWGWIYVFIERVYVLTINSPFN